jgi:tRNA-2-methylthio-N6-dimethylallyladenosine synthase
VKQIRRERVHLLATDMPEIEKFDHLPKAVHGGFAAFVTIMEGCDKFCTFCVVPYTRGPELSRPVEDVLRECREVLAAGALEITLLGQNVNGYLGTGPDGEEWDFSMLLYAVARLEGLKRLRFFTSHPMEVNDGLVEAFAELPVLMPFLHLPVQSGSDRILKAMHRGHNRAHYLKLVESIRKARPDIALSSDFIVGFPGETDEDFADTLDLVRTVGFDTAFCFNYSPRPGTPAAKVEDSVPQDVKDARLQELLVVLRQQTREKHHAHIGRLEDVLVERPSKTEGDMQGRTPDFKIVHFQGMPDQVGKIVPLRITGAYGQSLRGEVVADA